MFLVIVNTRRWQNGFDSEITVTVYPFCCRSNCIPATVVFQIKLCGRKKSAACLLRAAPTCYHKVDATRHWGKTGVTARLPIRKLITWLRCAITKSSFKWFCIYNRYSLCKIIGGNFTKCCSAFSMQVYSNPTTKQTLNSSSGIGTLDTRNDNRAALFFSIFLSVSPIEADWCIYVSAS